MSVAFHRSPTDWLLNPSILTEAVNAIKADVKLDTTFEIPYVAGYSRDGKCFYIDSKLPAKWQGFDLSLTLLLHETVERALEGLIPKLPYQLAHQIALNAEKAAVEAFKLNWVAYNRFFNGEIKEIGSRKRYAHCPKDLDLEPYRDEEDWATLKKMFHEGRPLWNGVKSHPGVT
jgi:hypothetical protein